MEMNPENGKVSTLFVASSFDFAEMLDADFIEAQICEMQTMARTSRMNNTPDKGQQQITDAFQGTYATTRQQESSMKTMIKAQLTEFGFAEEVCDIAANSVQKITDKGLALNVAIDTATSLVQARLTKGQGNDTHAQKEDVKVGPVTSRPETEAERMRRICFGSSKPIVTPNKAKESQLKWHISPSFLKSEHDMQKSKSPVASKKQPSVTMPPTTISFEGDAVYEMQLNILMDQVEKQQKEKQIKEPTRASYGVTIKPKEPKEQRLKEPPMLVRLKDAPVTMPQLMDPTGECHCNIGFFNYGESTLTQGNPESLLTQPKVLEVQLKESDSEHSDEQEADFDNTNEEAPDPDEKVEFDDVDDGLVDTDESEAPRSRQDLHNALTKKRQKVMRFFDTEAVEDNKASRKTKTSSARTHVPEESDDSSEGSFHRHSPTKKVIHIEDSSESD